HARNRSGQRWLSPPVKTGRCRSAPRCPRGAQGQAVAAVSAAASRRKNGLSSVGGGPGSVGSVAKQVVVSLGLMASQCRQWRLNQKKFFPARRGEPAPGK